MRDLTICTYCKSDCVVPIQWEERDALTWTVSMRCGACEYQTVGVFPQAVVDHYDDRLSVGMGEIEDSLRKRERERFTREVETFSRALEAGAIMPEDF
jgi:hypothetical protein